MATNKAHFMECTSLNISYDVMGIATVSYTIVHEGAVASPWNQVQAGGQTFTGYITNMTTNVIPRTKGWFETHVTLITTTN